MGVFFSRIWMEVLEFLGWHARNRGPQGASTSAEVDTSPVSSPNEGSGSNGQTAGSNRRRHSSPTDEVLGYVESPAPVKSGWVEDSGRTKPAVEAGPPNKKSKTDDENGKSDSAESHEFETVPCVHFGDEKCPESLSAKPSTTEDTLSVDVITKSQDLESIEPAKFPESEDKFHCEELASSVDDGEKVAHSHSLDAIKQSDSGNEIHHLEESISENEVCLEESTGKEARATEIGDCSTEDVAKDQEEITEELDQKQIYKVEVDSEKTSIESPEDITHIQEQLEPNQSQSKILPVDTEMSGSVIEVTTFNQEEMEHDLPSSTETIAAANSGTNDSPMQASVSTFSEDNLLTSDSQKMEASEDIEPIKDQGDHDLPTSKEIQIPVESIMEDSSDMVPDEVKPGQEQQSMEFSKSDDSPKESDALKVVQEEAKQDIPSDVAAGLEDSAMKDCSNEPTEDSAAAQEKTEHALSSSEMEVSSNEPLSVLVSSNEMPKVDAPIENMDSEKVLDEATTDDQAECVVPSSAEIAATIDPPVEDMDSEKLSDDAEIDDRTKLDIPSSVEIPAPAETPMDDNSSANPKNLECPDKDFKENDQIGSEPRESQFGKDASIDLKDNDSMVEIQWHEEAKSVFICGSWNDWKEKCPLQLTGDVWSTKIKFGKALDEVQFKFVVDEVWRISDKISTKSDGQGNENNIIYLKH